MLNEINQSQKIFYDSTYVRGFPGGTSGKDSTCRCRRCKRHRFNPWVGKTSRRRKWQPLQYSCLGNPTGRGDGRATDHRVTELDTTEETESSRSTEVR